MGVGRGRWDKLREGTHMYTLPCVKWMASGEAAVYRAQGAQLGALRRPRGVGTGVGGRQVQEGGDKYICTG